MKKLLSIFLLLVNASCIANSPQKLDVSIDSNLEKTDFGGGYTQDCVSLTRNLDKDILLINPTGKNMTKNDLGVGTDSYLNMRFSVSDKNKNDLLDLIELEEYLGPNSSLAEVCRAK